MKEKELMVMFPFPHRKLLPMVVESDTDIIDDVVKPGKKNAGILEAIALCVFVILLTYITSG